MSVCPRQGGFEGNSQICSWCQKSGTDLALCPQPRVWLIPRDPYASGCPELSQANRTCSKDIIWKNCDEGHGGDSEEGPLQVRLAWEAGAVEPERKLLLSFSFFLFFFFF